MSWTKLALNKFRFFISEGKANLLQAISTWPGSWRPKKHSWSLIAPHIETVGRLLVWSDCLSTRDDILLPSIVLVRPRPNFPKPGNVLRGELGWTMSEEGVVSIWDGLLPSCGLGRRGRDWFNELMRRGAAYLICALALHPYNDPDFIFVSLLPLWPRRNQDSSRHLDVKVTYLEWYQRLMLCLAI